MGQIKDRLRGAAGFEGVRLGSWIMREAAFADVWTFLTPIEVRDHLTGQAPDYLLEPLDLAGFRAFVQRLRRQFARTAHPGGEARG